MLEGIFCKTRPGSRIVRGVVLNALYFCSVFRCYEKNVSDLFEFTGFGINFGLTKE